MSRDPQIDAALAALKVISDPIRKSLMGEGEGKLLSGVRAELRGIVINIDELSATDGSIYSPPTLESIASNVAFLEELRDKVLPDLLSDTPSDYYIFGNSYLDDFSQDFKEKDFKKNIIFDYVFKIYQKATVRRIKTTGLKNQYVANFEDKQIVFSGGAGGLSNENTRLLRERLIKSIEEGNFKNDFGTNAVISYVIQNGFSFNDASIRVATAVQKKVNILEDISIQINGKDQTLFSLDNETKNSETYLTITQKTLGSNKEVRSSVIGELSTTVTLLEKSAAKQRMGIKGISQNTVLFPSEVYGDNEDALELLRTDTSLGDNKDITSYEFNFYKEQPSVGFFESIEGFLFASPSPQELIKINLENKYLNFILKVLADYKDDGELSTTVTGAYNSTFDNDFTIAIYSMIAIDKELARRVATFNAIADASEFLDPDKGEELSADDINKIEQEGAQAFIESKIQEGKTKLTDEEIGDRQRFYKQCALLMNISTLAPKFDTLVVNRQKTAASDGPLKDKPFGGRFFRADSENKESLITNLVSSKDSSYMFEIPSHVMTQLTPKFKIYKVMNEQSGKLVETEFIFPMQTDLTRKKNFKVTQGTSAESAVPDFLSSQFDKGDGCGLKSFTVDFNGTNPAEARNDIKGSMSLHFQSFADFTRKRISTNGKEYRFVDLIIQPPPDEAGVQIVSLRQYEPSFYRIRVEMGYNVPKKGEIEGITGKDFEKLQNAVKTMNKSFFLCMVDHDFNIKNDGSVDMNFTYRAYLETALKSVRFDALTTPELAKKRISNAKKLFEVANSMKCTQEELRELQLALAGEERQIRLDSLNSILKRLVSRGKVFNVEINNNDRKFFLKRGFFTTCRLNNQVDLENNPDNSNTNDLGIILGSNFLSEDSDTNFKRDVDDTNVQFFFFGDLLHTILDALYDPETESVAVGLENTKIILGSFDFDPYEEKKKDKTIGFNIGSIPISVDFFSEWFRDNVLNQQSTRKTFPILNFIRSLSNYLVSNALLEVCVDRSVEQKLMFQTGQVSAISKGGDPVGSLVSLEAPILNTDQQRGQGTLPLVGDVERAPTDKGSPIEDFYHYIILNANGSALTYAGSGKYSDDIEAGRFHVQIGSNRGIVKTVQFAKTDMQYIREARFFRQGVDGLLQLSSVYTANVEMFGNTLFYPGMELWIDPYGIGGTHIGRPQQGGNDRSLANILGLGGYHTITGVSTTISPQSFTTKLKSQHYYSGDGESPDKSSAKVSKKKNSEDLLIEMGVNESFEGRDAKFCESTILNSLNYDPDADNIDPTSTAEPLIDDDTQPSNAQSSATTSRDTSQTTLDKLLEKYPYGDGTFQGRPGAFRIVTRESDGVKKYYFFPYDGDDKIRITG